MARDRTETRDARRTAAVPALSFLSLLGLAFVLGAVFAALNLEPARLIVRGFAATQTLVAEMTQDRPGALRPIAHEGEGVVVHDRARASAGLTMVQGILPGGPQIRVIDMDGRELHRWDVDFFAAWHDPVHIHPPENVPKSRFFYHTQGFSARPDGSVLVNIADKGAVMLDRCSGVQWTVDEMTHHSITPAPDGGYFLASHKPISEIDDELLPPDMTRAEVTQAVIGEWHYPENTVLRIDRDGNYVQSHSVLEAVYDAELEAALHDGRANRHTDPTHLNDIELVTGALAAKMPGVAAGDLLISLRNMNMLAVIDADDGSLKWRKRGPWVRQHDPDITADGRIELFNNRSALSGGLQEGSQILGYDPATDEVEVLHPAGDADRFTADIMGSHQLLPNGNRLIVESTLGRVFEATRGGDVVWSYVLPYDSEFAALIEDATRVPADFFTVTDWSCE